MYNTLAYRSVRAALAGLVLAALSACSTDRLTGPSLSAAHGSVATPSTLTTTAATISTTALLRTTALSAPITRSLFVTKARGGWIQIPEAGMDLKVPAGAISGDTLTISVTALAGAAVAYEFQPHGTKFLKPLYFSQSTTGTTWLGGSTQKVLGGGYFKAASQINPLTGASLIDERLPLTINGQWVFMDLWHFSGYMVSMD